MKNLFILTCFLVSVLVGSGAKASKLPNSISCSTSGPYGANSFVKIQNVNGLLSFSIEKTEIGDDQRQPLSEGIANLLSVPGNEPQIYDLRVVVGTTTQSVGILIATVPGRVDSHIRSPALDSDSLSCNAF